jgi:acid stress chaperone HdeA
MTTRSLTRWTVPAMIALVAATLSLTACDKAKEAVNKGGDTPCNEFIAQDHDKQQVTVRKYLQNDTQVDDPSPQTVDGAISAIDLMCRAQANAQTPIRNADLSGVLVPKK